MVTACRRGGVCSYLQRRRCLFGHSAEEVAAALLEGSEDPRDDVLTQVSALGLLGGIRAQGMRRRPMPAGVSLSVGRTASCEPRALGG